jgi:hypothetical protein
MIFFIEIPETRLQSFILAYNLKVPLDDENYRLEEVSGTGGRKGDGRNSLQAKRTNSGGNQILAHV